MRRRVPSVEEVLAIHGEILRRTGGEPGILSRSALASALARAAMGHADRPSDLADRAALLLRGIAQEHPFADGNKRTAYGAVEVFLGFNGHRLRTEAREAEEFMLRVASAGPTPTLDEMADWLRARLEKVYDSEA